MRVKLQQKHEKKRLHKVKNPDFTIIFANYVTITQIFNKMYNYNHKMLKLIFGGYAIIITLSILLNILISECFHLGSEIGNVIYYTNEIILTGLIIWSAISGKRIGINTLGRIGAWIAVPTILSSLAINCYTLTLYDDYYLNSDIIQALQVIQFIVSIIIFAALTLWTLGSKLNILAKIAFITALFAGSILSWSISFIGLPYDMYWIWGVIRLIFWLAAAVLILVLPTRE